MNNEFAGTVTSQYERTPLIKSMKIMLGQVELFLGSGSYSEECRKEEAIRDALCHDPGVS